MVATAERKPRKAASENEPEPKLVLPVQFGDVTIGDGVAGITISISRDKLKLDTADEYLCCKRLIGRILILPGGDDEAQTYILGTKTKHAVKGSFDVRSFRVTPKSLGTRLSFSIESIDIEELSHFAKQNGLVVVELMQAIPDEKKSKDANGQKQLDDIGVLNLSIGSENMLRSHNITTVDALTTILKAGQLKSVCKTKACMTEVEDAHFKYLQNGAPGDNGAEEEEGEDE